jgi:hypothetical protein
VSDDDDGNNNNNNNNNNTLEARFILGELQEFKAPRICGQSAHENGKFVRRTHRPPLPPLSVRGLVDPTAMVSGKSSDPIGN